MRCRTQRVRLDYSCPDAIFDGYTSSTAKAVPLPLKGKAKSSRRLEMEQLLFFAFLSQFLNGFCFVDICFDISARGANGTFDLAQRAFKHAFFAHVYTVGAIGNHYVQIFDHFGLASETFDTIPPGGRLKAVTVSSLNGRINSYTLKNNC